VNEATTPVIEPCKYCGRKLNLGVVRDVETVRAFGIRIIPVCTECRATHREEYEELLDLPVVVAGVALV
jgi:hypothetical protein